jgi:hypothetical protein
VAVWACFEVIPSPKSQNHEVGAPPLPVSVNNTTRGAFPDLVFAVKEATGLVDSADAIDAVKINDRKNKPIKINLLPIHLPPSQVAFSFQS